MKKRKQVCIFLLMLTIFFPRFIFAEEKEKKEYQDVVAKTLHLETSDKIRIYFFHGDGCPHCAEEEIFLEEIEKKYSEIEIIRYEVWYNAENNEKLNEIKSYFLTSSKGVPFTVIGNEYFSGYNSTIKKQIQNEISTYLEIEIEDVENASIVENPIVKGIFLLILLIIVFLFLLLLKKRNKKEISASL